MTYPGRTSPVPGARIPREGSRRWGDYRPGHQEWNPLHAGVDLVGVPGTPVVAPERSRVLAVATRSGPPWTGYAPCVFLAGESGRFHLLAHLSGSPLVLRVGDVVELGQQLGTIGAAERHTHWEVRTREHRGGHEPAIDATLSPADWVEGVDVPFWSGPLTAGSRRSCLRLRRRMRPTSHAVAAAAGLCSQSWGSYGR